MEGHTFNLALRGRQACSEFKSSLVCIMSSRLARARSGDYFKEEKKGGREHIQVLTLEVQYSCNVLSCYLSMNSKLLLLLVMQSGNLIQMYNAIYACKCLPQPSTLMLHINKVSTFVEIFLLHNSYSHLKNKTLNSKVLANLCHFCMASVEVGTSMRKCLRKIHPP